MHPFLWLPTTLYNDLLDCVLIRRCGAIISHFDWVYVYY